MPKKKEEHLMSDIVEMTLYAGPLDGNTITIHRDNLKIKPRISVEAENGEMIEYALDDDGKFVWLSDPDDPKVARGMFVCDDDGNVISEEGSISDALDKLQDLEDDEAES
jgi:hypothetical protein